MCKCDKIYITRIYRLTRFWMYTSVVLNAFTLSCNSSPEHFSSCKMNSVPVENKPALPPAGPWHSSLYLLSLWVSLLLVLHVSAFAQYWSLWLADFTEHNVLEVHLCRSRCRNPLPFYSGIIVYCGMNPFCWSICQWALGCFHVWAPETSPPVHVGVVTGSWPWLALCKMNRRTRIDF